MNIQLLLNAERKTIHDFRFVQQSKKVLRGATAVQYVTGMNAGTLNNQVNVNVTTHKLSHIDSLLIQQLTDDHQMHELGARFLGRISYDNVSDMAILDCFASLIKEVGEHAAAVRDSLNVGKFTRSEFEKTLSEWEDIVRAGYELQHRLEQIIDDDESGAMYG